MIRLFSRHHHALLHASFLVTLLLADSYPSSAQFKRDTVLLMALTTTGGQSYPPAAITDQHAYLLTDSFSLAQTQKWIDRKRVNPESLSSAIALGNNYFAEIEALVAKHELPPAYQWIPLTLSGMQYDWYGPDGRAGLWQLPHLMAVRFGLTLTPYLDQRLDPLKNTHVALKYLSYLNESFGDPHHALLAFFNSEGSARAALRNAATVRFRNEASRMSFIYQQLPPSTRDDIYLWNYIASVLPEHPPFRQQHPNGLASSSDSVQIDHRTSVAAMCILLEISERELLAYNPSLIGKIIPAGTVIFLPERKPENLHERMQKVQTLHDSIARANVSTAQKPTPADPSISPVMYTVRQGDNLGRIASRHGITVRQLKDWNNLRNDRINAGQQLMIYTKEPVQTSPGDTASHEPESGEFIEYTVKQGDSLWSISRKFPGVSVEDIMRWNNTGERIAIGQVLKIKKQ